jgi:phosphoglycolate phosphatase/AHBA synthesis associated protein
VTLPVIAAVLFDLDGVLIDSYEVWFAVMRAVMRGHGREPITRERFAETWGQPIEHDIAAFFPDLTTEALARAYEARYASELSHLRVIDGAREVLVTLRERGVRTAVVTNSPAAIARAALEHAELPCDVLVGGDDVARGKPEPDMLIEACRRLGVGTADALMLGDSIYDRKAADAGGVRFVGYRTEGDARIERLEELLELLGA